MPESLDLDKIETHITKIESDILLLLQQITEEKIPDRATMVSRDYFKRLQQYDIVSNRVDSSEESRSIPEDEPRNTVQFIKSILVNIPSDIDQRRRYLEKLLGYFSSISVTDKAVLIQSLLNESEEKIRAAIQEIVDAFS